MKFTLLTAYAIQHSMAHLKLDVASRGLARRTLFINGLKPLMIHFQSAAETLIVLTYSIRDRDSRDVRHSLICLAGGLLFGMPLILCLAILCGSPFKATIMPSIW